SSDLGRMFRSHVEDAVGVDVERHLNLGHATRRRWDAREVELAQRAVLRRQWTFALQHVHFNRSLTVSRGRERFSLLGRNRRIARYHRRTPAAQGFKRQRQRGYVQQEQVFDFALERATLNGRT